MKIVLLGGNGRTGQELLKLAIKAGDEVCALVRNTNTLDDFKCDNLSVHGGDVCDVDTISALLLDQDVVISTLGPRSIGNKSCSIYSRAVDAIVPAMERSDVKRLLVTSTALLFPPRKVSDHILRFIAHNNHRHAGLMEERIESSNLDWTIARVGFLNSKDSEKFEFAHGRLPKNGSGISRVALANYLYHEAVNGNHKQQIIGVSGN